MKINVQSIKFDADQKLLDFIDKKVGKLEKFFDNIISCFSVTRDCPMAGRSRFLWVAHDATYMTRK